MTSETGLSARLAQWGVEEVLARFPGLSFRPQRTEDVVIGGRLECRLLGPRDVALDVAYDLEICVPPRFPRVVPRAWETGGAIPHSWHRNPDGELCLATPVEQQLILSRRPTLAGFVENLVLPYLYSHAHYVRMNGQLPFGERPHGAKGLREQLAIYLELPLDGDIVAALHLTGLRRRPANKWPCPCRSGLRLGRCHHREINAARVALGRSWWRGYLWQFVQNVTPQSRIPRRRGLHRHSAVRSLLDASYAPATRPPVLRQRMLAPAVSVVAIQSSGS